MADSAGRLRKEPLDEDPFLSIRGVPPRSPALHADVDETGGVPAILFVRAVHCSGHGSMIFGSLRQFAINSVT